jgi:hypothetical protein
MHTHHRMARVVTFIYPWRSPAAMVIYLFGYFTRAHGHLQRAAPEQRTKWFDDVDDFCIAQTMAGVGATGNIRTHSIDCVSVCLFA